MEPWQIGLVVLCALGLGAIAYGALGDRARNRRRAAEMQAPPERVIPQFDPAAPGPRYLSELQARRHPESASDWTDPVPLTDPATIKVGFASRDFATDRAQQQAALGEPLVCICDDPVASLRELLGVLELAGRAEVPLVIVAPAVEAPVLGTLGVNRIQRKLAVLVVIAPKQADRATVAALSGATPTVSTDRQAGYLPTEHLGQLARWVATNSASYLTEIPVRG